MNCEICGKQQMTLTEATVDRPDVCRCNWVKVPYPVPRPPLTADDVRRIVREELEIFADRIERASGVRPSDEG